MRGLTHRMRRVFWRPFAGSAICVFCIAAGMGSPVAKAQEAPPLTVPNDKLPARPAKGLTAGGWLFLPSVKAYTAYTDNLFQTVTSPISIWSIGINPAMQAEWSNGIHTTLLYGSVDARGYPSDNNLNLFDAQAGFTQKYSPLPDLTFRLQGNYSHQTNASQFIGAIPGELSAPATSTVLPNGNTVLPNGNIITPGGQLAGHIAPSVNVQSAQVQLNPSNQYTATASVDKILNRAFVGLSGSLSRTEYQNQAQNSDYTVKSVSGRAATWIGPLFYAFANGSYAAYAVQNAYRAIGGIGTRQIGLFRASIYAGYQGSQVDNGSDAGGEVYGGAISYYPTPFWTISANIDETVNVSNQTTATNLALNIPAPTALYVPIGTSTRVTSAALHSGYQISEEWAAFGSVGYTHSEYLNSSQRDDAWLADLQLRYQMWEHMYLSWEYQYSEIVSNMPLSSSHRNFVGISAIYNY